jgi:hypothetical protein
LMKSRKQTDKELLGLLFVHQDQILSYFMPAMI